MASMYERLSRSQPRSSAKAPACEFEGCERPSVARTLTIRVCAEHDNALKLQTGEVAHGLFLAGAEICRLRAWLAQQLGQHWQADPGLLAALTATVQAIIHLERYVPMPDGHAPGDWAE